MASDIPNPLWVFRITHFENLDYIFHKGLYAKGHKNFDTNFVNIGNFQIIDFRASFEVKIDNYGNIGDYVPFYFGRQSIMLYNILTNTNVEKQDPEDIVYLCCKVDNLISECEQYFFTDGQANKQFTGHYTDLKDLNKLDWNIINGSDFKNSEDDPDKKRRYQAEFLVFEHVPITCIGAVIVYSGKRKIDVEDLIKNKGLDIPVRVRKENYYFYF